MNPFYKPPQYQTPFQNMGNLINQLKQFASTFQGDPRQKVQDLLSSGQMTQEQFQNFSQVANQFKQFIPF